jgi:type I restriction enzyme S subunit
MAGEWKRTSLREAGVTLIDCDHRTPPAADSGYPYVAIPQLKEGRLALADARRISPEHFADWTRKAKPQHHDVILSRRCNPGETAFVPAGLECALGQNLVLLRSDGTKVFPPFLRWLLNGPDWWEQVGTFINVGAIFNSLKCADIPNFKMQLPPLAEQKAIAAVLGALDDKIELNRRMNATLEAMARALFQSWFVDFDPVRAKLDGRQPAALDPATAALFPEHLEDSPLGQIPKGWKVGNIQECCGQIQNGGTPRRNEPRFWDGGNIPWLASGEVRQSIITATESFITEEGLAESSAKWVPAFSTVVALYGATAGQVSFTSSRLTTNQAVCALISKKGFEFFNYLTMRGATAELENKAVGSAQQNISKGIVEETKVVLPPPALVERFAALASPLFERWISNLHQSRTLATLRDTLLPKLLSGELSVADLESRLEVAS